VSIRSQIRDQLITELNATLPTDVPEATKRRWVPGQRLPEPRLAVFFGPNETVAAKPVGFPIQDRELIISVQAALALEDPAESDDALEPMLAHVSDVLSDTTLEGLVTRIEEIGTEWGGAQLDLFYVVAAVRFKMRYQTKIGDLSAKQ